MNKRIAFLSILILLATACSGSTVYKSIRAAKKAARNSGRDILIIFSNPADCYACGKLDREILKKESWKSFRGKHFETAQIILTGKKRISGEYKKFRISSIPAVFLMTKRGIPYARTGYIKGGPGAYISHIRALLREKKKIGSLLKSVSGTKRAEAASALSSLLDTLEKKNLVQFYTGLLKQGEQIDPENKKGLHLRTATHLYKLAAEAGKRNRMKNILMSIRKLDPGAADKLQMNAKLDQIEKKWMARYKWREALDALNTLEKRSKNPAARLYTMQGRCYYQLAKYAKSIMILKKALRLPDSAPVQRRIRAWIRSAAYQLKKQKGRH